MLKKAAASSAVHILPFHLQQVQQLLTQENHPREPPKNPRYLPSLQTQAQPTQATMSSTDATPAGDAKDNSYVSRTGQNQIPVQKDEAPVEDPIDAATANTDKQLGQFYLPLPSVLHPSHIFPVRYVTDSPTLPARDDTEAINPDNIVDGGRTRGAKPSGAYTEPGDEEGLPANDGTSSTR